MLAPAPRLASLRSCLSIAALVAAGAVSTAGCDTATAADGSPLPSAPPVAPAGPFAVGTTSFEVSDRDHPEPHTEATDDNRRFVVRAWYPAAAPAGAPAPYFLNAAEGAANAAVLGLPADAFEGPGASTCSRSACSGTRWA